MQHMDAWIYVLRKRYHANPQHFRSERMCFLDHLFSQQWKNNYKYFKESAPDVYGLGRRLPGGAWNYYSGAIPSFCRSNKVWGWILMISMRQSTTKTIIGLLYGYRSLTGT